MLSVLVVIVPDRLTVLVVVLKGGLWLLRHLRQEITLAFDEASTQILLPLLDVKHGVGGDLAILSPKDVA